MTTFWYKLVSGISDTILLSIVFEFEFESRHELIRLSTGGPEAGKLAASSGRLKFDSSKVANSAGRNFNGSTMADNCRGRGKRSRHTPTESEASASALAMALNVTRSEMQQLGEEESTIKIRERVKGSEFRLKRQLKATVTSQELKQMCVCVCESVYVCVQQSNGLVKRSFVSRDR